MKEEFLQKLKELLTEYNVSINADVGAGSDTHGIHGRYMEISKRIPNTFRDEVWLKVNDWEISQYEL